MSVSADAPLKLHVSIPRFFLCPISLELMTDPVTLSSGQTYDRCNIQKWLDDGHSTCPVTRMPINAELEELIPNHALRRMIQAWCVQNKSFGIESVHTPRQPPSLKQLPYLLEQVRLHQAAVDDEGRRLTADALQKLCMFASDRSKARLLLLRQGAQHVLPLFLSKSLPLCTRPSALSAEVEDVLYLLAILSEDTEDSSQGTFSWEPASKEEVIAIAKVITDARTTSESRRNAAILLKSATTFESWRRDVGEMEGFMNAVVGLIREAPKDSMANLRYGSSTACSLEFFSVAGIGLLHAICKPSTKNRYSAIQAGALGALATLLRDIRPDPQTCPSSGHKRIIELSLKVWECLCKCADGRAATHQMLGLLIGLMCNVSQRATKYSIHILWLLLKFAPICSPIGIQIVEMGGLLKLTEIARGTPSPKTRSLANKVANAVHRSVIESSTDHINSD